MKNDNWQNFEDEVEEAPDFDLTEGEYVHGGNPDIVPDCFLTDDAYEIMEDVHRKVSEREKKEKKEEAITSVWIILVLVLVLAAIILYSFRDFY